MPIPGFTIDGVIPPFIGPHGPGEEEQIEGQLGGFLPDAHQFEFRSETRGALRGGVDRAIPASDLAEMNRTHVNVDAVATLKVRRVIRNGEMVRESFTLLQLAPKPEAPADPQFSHLSRRKADLAVYNSTDTWHKGSSTGALMPSGGGYRDRSQDDCKCAQRSPCSARQ